MRHKPSYRELLKWNKKEAIVMIGFLTAIALILVTVSSVKDYRVGLIASAVAITILVFTMYFGATKIGLPLLLGEIEQ